MSTCNVYFCGEIRKILTWYLLLSKSILLGTEKQNENAMDGQTDIWMNNVTTVYPAPTKPVTQFCGYKKYLFSAVSSEPTLLNQVPEVIKLFSC